jgi:hypothetical protein
MLRLKRVRGATVDHSWFAVDLVSRSTFGKLKQAGLIYIGWQGIRVGWWQHIIFGGLVMSRVCRWSLGWLLVSGAAPTGAPLVMGSIW